LEDAVVTITDVPERDGWWRSVVIALSRTGLSTSRSLARMTSDADREDLKDSLLDLSTRLAALDETVEEGNEDARASLTEAWRAYNRLARIIDPLMVCRRR